MNATYNTTFDARSDSARVAALPPIPEPGKESDCGGRGGAGGGMGSII